MANVRSGNTWYVDSNGVLGNSGSSDYTSMALYEVIITATAANGTVLLQDANTSNTKMQLSIDANFTTKQISFRTKPMLFSQGISIGSISNCVLTLLVSTQGG